MAVTISRTHYGALIDDDGSNAVGTPWVKARVGDLLDDIDAALAQVLPLAGGVIGPLQIDSAATFALNLNQTNAGDADFRLGRSGAVPATWDLYIPGGSTDFVIYGTSAVLRLTQAGLLKLLAYTGTTFAAGDKYLVVDASGNVHRSAIGPAS